MNKVNIIKRRRTHCSYKQKEQNNRFWKRNHDWSVGFLCSCKSVHFNVEGLQTCTGTWLYFMNYIFDMHERLLISRMEQGELHPERSGLNDCLQLVNCVVALRRTRCERVRAVRKSDTEAVLSTPSDRATWLISCESGACICSNAHSFAWSMCSYPEGVKYSWPISVLSIPLFTTVKEVDSENYSVVTSDPWLTTQITH